MSTEATVRVSRSQATALKELERFEKRLGRAATPAVDAEIRAQRAAFLCANAVHLRAAANDFIATGLGLHVDIHEAEAGD